LGDHQVEVGFAGDFGKFELGVRLSRRVKLAALLLSVKDPLLDRILQLRYLYIFAPQLVLVLRLFAQNPIQLPLHLVLLTEHFLPFLASTSLLYFLSVLELADLLKLRFVLRAKLGELILLLSRLGLLLVELGADFLPKVDVGASLFHHEVD